MAVIANLASGTPCADEERLGAIRHAFRAVGADPPIVCAAGDGLAQACSDAVTRGAQVLVAAGGDGTVSAVAGAVAGTSTTLAVLPLGTMNHFAKDARLPLDMEEAARVALEGRAGPVDVAEVNGRVFVNNASIGLYPDALRERERRQAASGSKPVATMQAAGTVLRNVRTHHLLLGIDGRPAARTTSFVLVGNNVYETGLLGLGSRSSLTGGRLSVYTVRRPGRRAVLGLAARALTGRLDQAHDFESHEATEVVVDSRRPQVRVGIDGELCMLDAPLRFTIRPRALRLVRRA